MVHMNLLSELHFMYMSVYCLLPLPSPAPPLPLPCPSPVPLLPLSSILSVPRVLKFLSCFDPEEPVMLGEAYGFYAHKPDGYSYVTGGGG